MKKMDLDTFGEIMDRFIHQNAVGLAVTKEADSDEWDIQGVGMGSVLDFYIYLNALKPLFKAMLKDMETAGGIETDKLADELTKLIKKDMVEAAKEMEGA